MILFNRQKISQSFFKFINEKCIWSRLLLLIKNIYLGFKQHKNFNEISSYNIDNNDWKTWPNNMSKFVVIISVYIYRSFHEIKEKNNKWKQGLTTP